MTDRRNLLKAMAVTGVGLTLGGFAAHAAGASGMRNKLKGNIRHSVARWTYGEMDIETLCRVVKDIGFSAIDLVGPDDWPVLKKHGIDSSMCNGAELNLEDGWCEPKFHDELTERYLKHIDLVADAGYTNLICFSGNKRGMSPQAGLENATKGLRAIVPHAEKRGVVLQMELFNSKIDHPDYMADNSAWGIALCKALNTENFKLLYDIYHMQVNEGDIIHTIRENLPYFGHFHTAGVPGRHEIGDNQELYYPAIAKAIKESGFTGYLAQEFIPTPDTEAGKIASLRAAVQICDV
ncbi:hydroxypyruvate isomerase family protein [Salinimonas sediminis]|uniref:Hydroxypyruvate isomerase n=1 Tax=Salinimonas sediminis TaxID=2303538 RepID=A0A346NR82_9ALTE|nr:TIM barrel protein [Salinimonas sediminis]AXR08039.1 hydroxypyruvate isomerase [Salinimonas sediminis]